MAVSMKASPAPSSICLIRMPPFIATELPLITFPQPLSRMALGAAIVTAAPPRKTTMCLPVKLPTIAFLQVPTLSIYSGLALNLWTGFGKMICKGFCFRRRLHPLDSGLTSISSYITFLQFHRFVFGVELDGREVIRWRKFKDYKLVILSANPK